MSNFIFYAIGVISTVLEIIGILVIFTSLSKILNIYMMGDKDANKYIPFKLKSIKTGILLITVGLFLQLIDQVASYLNFYI